MKISKGKPDVDGKVLPDAAAYDGARLREGLIDRSNTATSVWADTAYRSAANETFLTGAGNASQIHRKRPKDRPMPKHHARANAKKSKVRARVEHAFGHQKDRMNLMARSIGIKRAEATIIMANIACNLGRSMAVVAWAHCVHLTRNQPQGVRSGIKSGPSRTKMIENARCFGHKPRK